MPTHGRPHSRPAADHGPRAVFHQLCMRQVLPGLSACEVGEAVLSQGSWAFGGAGKPWENLGKTIMRIEGEFSNYCKNYSLVD